MTHIKQACHGRRKTPCGRMWACDNGVDLACMWDGKVHTLRLRYCLDARQRVRLLGTGVAYGKLLRVEVTRARITATPKSAARLVRKCIDNARPTLNQALRTYVASFSPAVRSVLDLSGFTPRRATARPKAGKVTTRRRQPRRRRGTPKSSRKQTAA